MEYDIDPEAGIENIGNLYRIKEVMKKAQSGLEITIGFIGGSITQGSLATTQETCYAIKVFKWWQIHFPQAKFIYLNAGIGGTTSQFGAARVQSDLLVYEPDFVIIEFSVNDENDEHFLETYEGLIRKVYRDEKNPAVLIVNNVRYDDGMNAQDIHNRIGASCRIPCVSMKNTIYRQVEAGVIPVREITSDDLHPNDCGHELVSFVITHFLEKVYAQINDKEEPVKELPEPLTKNTYECSVRYQNYNSAVVSNGFSEDTSKQEAITQIFKNGWTAEEKGSSIVFRVAGSGIAVQYRKSVCKPTPIAIVVVDGDEDNASILDGNFEENWGDCLYLQTITEHTEQKMHEVEIRIIETHVNDIVPFYLAAVLTAN